MAKKEIFTTEQIEQDIINALKMPADKSEEHYQKTSIISTILSILAILIGIFYPTVLLWGIIALIVLPIIWFIISRFRLRHGIKKVSIDDYEVTEAVVSHTKEEEFVVRYYKHSKTILVYTIYFENGKKWDIPKDNYLWSVERPMSDFAIFQTVHRGDLFIVVSRKENGDIVMAYDTEFFEYKEK